MSRICFQIEEAQWYYEDFIRPLDPNLPSMSLRNFSLKLFQHCPLFSDFSKSQHMLAFERFLDYKGKIPVRGTILLNADMDQAVMVKGWKKGASWSFPRGKINKDEDDLDCAIRETSEETGYDLEASGLLTEDRTLVKSVDYTGQDQHIRLFVVRNVPMDTPFQTQTRKEISKIQWWRLCDLPGYKRKQHHQHEAAAVANKFYLVAPFLPQLKKWISDQKQKDTKMTANNPDLEPAENISHDEDITEDDQQGEPIVNYNASSSQDAERSRRNAAEKALSAIVQLHGPTQGLQPCAINPAQSQAPHGSGQQLLALLHSKPPMDQPPTTLPPPQTPLDQTIPQPHFPQTPHHQVPRASHILNQPPPPTFPMQQQQAQRPTQTYSHQQPDLHVRHDERVIPNMQYRHQEMPQQIPQQIHHQLPQQRERHPYQPPLIHPQPLPPNAGRLLFTGAPIQSTMVPQHIQQQPLHPNFTNSGSMPLLQLPNVNATMVPPQPKQGPTALTSHSLSLLHAFKTRDQANGNATSSHLPSHGPAQAHANTLVPEAQELPGESSRPMQVPISTEALQSSKLVPSLNAGIPSTIGHNQTVRPPISEQQRSTLLGIFKSPATQTATLAAAPAAVALPTSGSPSAVELSAVEVVSPPPFPPQKTTNGNATPGSTGHEIPEMNPELNLPFRATSILTRPTNGHKDAKPYGSLSKKPITRSEMHNSKIAPKTSPGKQFQPQILKRPQANTINASPLLAPSTIAAYSPSLAPSNIAGPSTSPLSFTSQAPQSTEQKHALLSLFGKSPVAASSSMSGTSSHDGPSINPLIDATMSAASRSGVGSLASGNGEGSSRRGSQTPISPADNKGFLLNYLDAIASRGY